MKRPLMFTIAGCCALSRCIVPDVHKWLVSPEVRGRVLEADTLRPIEGSPCVPAKASKRRFENWQRRVVPSPGVTSHLTLELIRGGSPSTVCGETQPRSAIVTTT